MCAKGLAGFLSDPWGLLWSSRGWRNLFHGGFTYIPKHYHWTTNSHSNQNVGFYINGIDVDFEKYSMFETKGKIKNNAIFNIVVDMFNNNIR